MRRPRRLSRPTTSERRTPRSEPSDRPVSFRGIWTRRPSLRIAIATWRRLRPPNRPKTVSRTNPKTRAVRAVYEAADDRATTRTAPDPGWTLRDGSGVGSRRAARSPESTRPPVARRSRSPSTSARRRRTLSQADVGRPAGPARSQRGRQGPEALGRPPTRGSEASGQCQRRPAPRVRARDARRVSTPVKRARFAFTMDSF
jgi:hypothetical protein